LPGLNSSGEEPFWLRGIELFNQGLAYESHEAFEALWIKSDGKQKLFLQILILMAAVEIHRKKGRPDTAQRVLKKIRGKLKILGIYQLFHLNQDHLKAFLNQLKENQNPKIPPS